MLWLTKPMLYGAAALAVALSAVALHYKLRGDELYIRFQNATAEVALLRNNAMTLGDALDAQNRALESMQREGELKDAVNALELEKARGQAEAAKSRAKGIAARQKPVDVPACTAAGNLFDEVVHGAQ